VGGFVVINKNGYGFMRVTQLITSVGYVNSGEIWQQEKVSSDDLND
jgi:hypothetical protein